MGFISGGTGGGGVVTPKYYGSFYSFVRQQPSVINTAYPMQVEVTNSTETSGFTVELDADGHYTQIKPAHTGVYNIQFSAQIATSNGIAKTIDIWFAIDGVEIDFSNSKVTATSNSSYIVASWNLFVALTDKQFIQVMWASTNTGVALELEAANGVHPAIPSVIITINQVN